MAKILVIDDEEDMRLLMCAILARGEHEAEAAADGETALRILASTRFDLILCDISMRGMSGYTVLSRVRELPESAHTPVVLVTGMADLKGMREGMKLGADDYLPKPFTVTELLSVVQTRIVKAKNLRKDAEDRAKSLRTHISLMLPQDLLNPLTGIIGLAGILCDEADTLSHSDAAEIARDIQKSGERLNRQINNFLIYSQIELLSTDQARLQALRSSPPTPLARMLTEVVEKAAASHKRVADLVIESCHADVAISGQNLEKILGEIADNAFKFSQPGTTVRVDSQVSGKVAVVNIRDGGRGIRPEVLDSIRNLGQMERFSTHKGDSGLGLAIAKRMAEIHNGRLTIAANDGPGTHVCIELPISGG
ncbi:MAG TPA: hybrid sensor histidine kinase/response regulator [Opitutaceae bacterium]